MKEHSPKFNIHKAKSRLVPNTPTPRQIQDKLDRRVIPNKQEVIRKRRQSAKTNRNRKEYK